MAFVAFYSNMTVSYLLSSNQIEAAMKKLLLVILLLSCSITNPHILYAQYGVGYSPQNSFSNIGIGLGGFNNYASSADQGYMYGQSANINAEANFILNQSLAGINNQTSYNMSLLNQEQRARTFFEKRQINRYYRDLEEWQLKEKAMLKREGLYDKDAIEYLYGGMRR